jgi:hypothetical protein
MKVFVLIKDETAYHGDRDVFGVYSTHDAAALIAEQETQQALSGWEDAVPKFEIEETEFHTET